LKFFPPKVLSNAGVGMMILQNTNNTISRMGYDSSKHKLMPRISVVMVSFETGNQLQKSLNENMREAFDSNVNVKLFHPQKGFENM